MRRRSRRRACAPRSGPGDCEALDDECGYEGVAVAAVCAETRAQADAAVALIDVEWEVLEPLLDADEAVARGEVLSVRERERGDLERGLAEADVVVEATYRTQTVLHNAMETHGIGVPLGRRDARGLHLDAGHLGRPHARSPRRWGIAADRVRVVCEFMGGGFGAKTDAGDYTLIAAELATRTGRPVRCTLTRREENVSSGNRNATIQRLVAGARSDGTLTALGGDYVNAVGWFGWNAFTEGPMQMLYACPNVKTTTRGAKVNTPPMRPFRAPGFVEGTFGLECLLDELAAKLDLDPLELRRRNHADREPGRDAPVQRQEPGRVLPAAPSRTGSAGTRCAPRSTETVKRGVGMASQIWYGGGGPPSYAWVRIGSDGRAAVITALQDVGSGTKTALGADRRRGARPAARARDRRRRRLGARARTRRSRAARRRRRRWARRRAPRPPTRSGRSSSSPRSATTRTRRSSRSRAARSSPRTARSWPLDEVVGLLGNGQILGTGARGPNPAGMEVLTFGVHVAEVAVDVETGEITVDRIAADPRHRPRDQPARRLEPGRGRDHPGRRPHALRGAAARPGDRARSSRARSTPTGCRRSPTCRRSSASSSTCPTRT